MAEFQSFLGRGWSFPPKFDEKLSTVQMVEDVEDIIQSLTILLSTIPGERITRPKYGCPLHNFVFSPNDTATHFLMRDAIYRSILHHEPRIDLDEVVFEKDGLDESILNVRLFFTVRGTNSRTNIVYPFYKLEGTDVTEV